MLIDAVIATLHTLAGVTPETAYRIETNLVCFTVMYTVHTLVDIYI